jgi:glycosyltransferase involved in cell wall biosynthesis
MSGAIVLAAYEPDEELFRRQLTSLQAQTRRDWECVIAVDGDPEPIAEMVERITGADQRFRVVGDGVRLGFYLNFERGLRAVSPDVEWVALCDQDDRWDHDKLDTLLPHLAEVSLVSGQARLVTYPAEQVTGTTERRDEGPIATVLSNQFTGSLCVFSTELLPTALPFPRSSTRAAAHDHWLAVVAGAYRGTRITEDVVQDYVQHQSNVFGDPSRDAGRRGLRHSWLNARDLAKKYEGSASIRSLLRTTFWVYVGWRQLMVDTLRARRPDFPDHERIGQLFGRTRRRRLIDRVLKAARRDGYVPADFVTQYRASWFAGALSGGRAAVARAVAQSGD